MKKIGLFAIAVFILVFSINTFAADNYLDVKYGAVNGTVDLSGKLGESAKVPVTVSIMKSSDPVPSDSNKPLAMYLVLTGEDGFISDSRAFAKDVLPVGSYIATASSENGEASAVFTVFDADSDETKAVLDHINTLSDSQKLASFLKEDKNIEKIGYVFEDTENHINSIAKFLIENRKNNGEDFTAETIDDAVKYAMLIASVKAGVPVDECILHYGDTIGCTIDDYDALSDQEKKELTKLLKESDYISTGTVVPFGDMLLICKARIPAYNWNSLKEYLEENADTYGLNIGDGSKYASIGKTEIQNVYENMRGYIQKAIYLEDIKDYFDDACKDYLENKNKNNNKENKKSGGGSSSSGNGVSMPATVTKLEELPDYKDQGAAPEAKFEDINDHFSKDAVLYLVDKGIINGYEDGSFRPDNTVTRAEAAAMIYRIIKDDSAVADMSGFSDVASDDWFAEAVYALAEKGIILGTDEGKFLPGEYISRQDIATIMARLANEMDIALSGEGTEFTDFDSISAYAQDAVNALSASGIIQGYEGLFRPQDTCTRGEISVMLYRLLTK